MRSNSGFLKTSYNQLKSGSAISPIASLIVRKPDIIFVKIRALLMIWMFAEIVKSPLCN